jgi:hypothetical protein
MNSSASASIDVVHMLPLAGPSNDVDIPDTCILILAYHSNTSVCMALSKSS